MMQNMTEHRLATAKAAQTYNAAADYFDHPVSSFWHGFGRQTIVRLNLQPGEKVLDVCSGSGGSALPAAEQVGTEGQVIAVDLASQLLALAEAKVRDQQLTQIEFRVADMLELAYPAAYFDAIVCVFGIFFVPDMPAAVRELWRMLKPGGRLAITTWGPDLFEPANSLFWDAVAQVRPDLQRGFNPWERISDPDGLKQMLTAAGLDKVDIMAESTSHPISSAEDWWTIAMGSGYRGTLEQLDAASFQQVYELNLQGLRQTETQTITTNVLYALARK